MKVYIITTETFPNGLAATQRIKCYAKSIVDLGLLCKVLCINRCEDPSAPLGNIATKGSIDGYEYRYMGSSTMIERSWKQKLNILGDIIRLVTIILFSINCKDCVILYSYNPLLFRLVSYLSRIKRFKFFYELNEHPSVHRRLYGIEGESQKDLEKIKKRLKDVDGIICISIALKNLLLRAGIEEKRIHIVNMLVNSSRFIGVDKKTTESYISYCGAADNKKDGVDRLIKAFSKIAPKYPELKLYIMGPKNNGSKNEEFAKKLGIEERVVFTGIISPDKMPEMLINAKVLALARPKSIQAQYGFPTKLGEYLLTGNPVVITKVGDIPIFLKNGESAYLADPDSIDDFAAQLEVALSDRNASVVGANGQKVALESFSGETVKSQLKVALSI